MAYTDVVNAINQYGSLYNYGYPTSYVGPYGAPTYQYGNVREITDRIPGPVDPRTAFRDPNTGEWVNPGWEQRLGTGSMGLQIGKTLGPGLSSLVNRSKFIERGATPVGGTAPTASQLTTAGESFDKSQAWGNLGLTAATTLYGATRDMNPYEYTTGEQVGDIVSPALTGMSLGSTLFPAVAAQAAIPAAAATATTAATAGTAATTGAAGGGPIGAIIGLLAGVLISQSAKKKTTEANVEAEKQFQKERTEYQERVMDEFREAREKGVEQRESGLWAQEASKYSNQYGAYANPFGQSYMGDKGMKFNYDKGGKFSKNELNKIKKAGRKGDTELAYVNPQEQLMLKRMGGSGSINPYTGLKEYGWLSNIVGDFMGMLTSPFEFVSDLVRGEEDAFGQFLDNWTAQKTRANIFGKETFMGGKFSDQEPTKIAISDPETGDYDIQTNVPGTTLGFDLTGDRYGSAGLGLTTPSGTGNIGGQAITGKPWLYGAGSKEGYAPAISRGPQQKKYVPPKDDFVVVNPFKHDISGLGDEQSASLGLEGFRWDLENPYIRENVDVFQDGGVLSQTQSMPLDSLLNRQLFTESSFNPQAESPKGAVGLSQITKDTFNDMIGWGWVPEGKKFSDLKTDTDLSTNLQERYMADLMTRDWNEGTDEVVTAKALAAYNMGPTGLVNKLNKIKTDGKDIYNNLDWLNSLSKETRNYVNKIMKGGGEKFESEYKKSWEAGGKEYDQGGKVNVVAEFTGNELIVNDQNEVEAGLASNDFTRAAAPIRKAMNGGLITPGIETHKGNPMPVDREGTIYAGGGALPFKVNKGAGIYDHATDQFNPLMTDKQIAMIAKKNINKW